MRRGDILTRHGIEWRCIEYHAQPNLYLFVPAEPDPAASNYGQEVLRLGSEVLNRDGGGRMTAARQPNEGGTAVTDHRTAASAPAADDTATRTLDDGEGPVVRVTQVTDRPGNLGVIWHRVTIDGRTFRSFIDAEEADEVALRLFDEVHRERRSRKAAAEARPVVAGLRELADFLEDHPALPEPSWAWAYRSDWNAPRDHHEARGELRAVASVLGVAPRIDSKLGRVTVSRAFGPYDSAVSYEVQWPIDAVTEAHKVTTIERVLPADLENLGAGGEA